MGRADYYREGDWNAVCYTCGRKRKASELVRHWQGFYACPEHKDNVRHPQDFVRGIPERQSPPWTQPEPPDVFVEISEILTTDVDSLDTSDIWLTTDDGVLITS
jgi:hypothetical protein